MSETIVISKSLPAALSWDKVRACLELTKPRIAGMVLVATLLGYSVSGAGVADPASWMRLVAALLGVGLVAGSANALNQVIEAPFDQRMLRTRGRPIPTGRLTPFEALSFAVGAGGLGVVILLVGVNPLAALLTALTLVSYVFVYTPLKRVTSLCVYVGAIPGALPPVIGWAAGSGAVALEAWLLFAILYFWQLPHFAAIAWQYRDDYAGAGYPMLSVGDAYGMRTSRHLMTHTVALLMASLLPALMAMAGGTYATVAMFLGAAFLISCVYFVLRRTISSARGVVIASVLYLPALFITMMVDKLPLR